MTAPETGAVPGGANVIKLSQRDLLDYRAVQRTFDGAYARTALGQLCYAIVILRLFQPKFFYVGLVYAILGIGFIPVAIFRYQMAVSNTNRFVALQVVDGHQSPAEEHASPSASNPTEPDGTTLIAPHPVDSVSQPEAPISAPLASRTVLRESFVTAGSVVAGATVFVGLAEVALLVLILRV
ncbi:hypothetical protein PaG_06494 [Moesziomyces aphidis]|uniref:DUF202 domain-containing protein n=1 Tax=Moesziomyces aphidis TaxID=84754 RepID=W3VFG4_MOEAP|nr:hypothetical protein PaG_06494 [Moesziomyces aphidis]